MTDHIEAVQKEVAKGLSPQKTAPQVNAWLLKRGQGTWLRKKFLVIGRHSGLGKTAFVRSLCGATATLELNCAVSEHVNLRDFEPLSHRCILWDEASVGLVLAQRKLFQAPAAWVDLGASATANYVYRVWVNDAVMVVCSNKWAVQLALCKKHDADWILANQEYVHVSEPLWESRAC